MVLVKFVIDVNQHNFHSNQKAQVCLEVTSENQNSFQFERVDRKRYNTKGKGIDEDILWKVRIEKPTTRNIANRDW